MVQCGASVSNNKEAFKVDCSDVISIEAADMSVRGGKKQRRRGKEIYSGGQGISSRERGKGRERRGVVCVAGLAFPSWFGAHCWSR